jgi:AcrR family transcriptional regulator
MSRRPDPVARILDGLVVALARYGHQRVSMTDVAAEAGVSRGTLYRYFPTKERLLAALGTHVLEEFRASLSKAVEATTAPEARIGAVLRTAATFVDDRPGLRRLAASEPALVIEMLRSNDGEIRVAIEEAVAPALGGGESGRRRHDAGVITEILFRLATSYPMSGRQAETASPEEMAAVLNAYVEGLTRAERPRASPRAHPSRPARRPGWGPR